MSTSKPIPLADVPAAVEELRKGAKRKPRSKLDQRLRAALMPSMIAGLIEDAATPGEQALLAQKAQDAIAAYHAMLAAEAPAKVRQSERAQESRAEVTRADVELALHAYAQNLCVGLLLKGWEKKVRTYLKEGLKIRIGERPLDMSEEKYEKLLNPIWRTVKARMPLPEMKLYLAEWEERGRAPDPGPDAADTK